MLHCWFAWFIRLACFSPLWNGSKPNNSPTRSNHRSTYSSNASLVVFLLGKSSQTWQLITLIGILYCSSERERSSRDAFSVGEIVVVAHKHKSEQLKANGILYVCANFCHCSLRPINSIGGPPLINWPPKPEIGATNKAVLCALEIQGEQNNGIRERERERENC